MFLRSTTQICRQYASVLLAYTEYDLVPQFGISISVAQQIWELCEIAKNAPSKTKEAN